MASRIKPNGVVQFRFPEHKCTFVQKARDPKSDVTIVKVVMPLLDVIPAFGKDDERLLAANVRKPSRRAKPYIAMLDTVLHNPTMFLALSNGMQIIADANYKIETIADDSPTDVFGNSIARHERHSTRYITGMIHPELSHGICNGGHHGLVSAEINQNLEQFKKDLIKRGIQNPEQYLRSAMVEVSIIFSPFDRSKNLSIVQARNLSTPVPDEAWLIERGDFDDVLANLPAEMEDIVDSKFGEVEFRHGEAGARLGVSPGTLGNLLLLTNSRVFNGAMGVHPKMVYEGAGDAMQHYRSYANLAPAHATLLPASIEIQDLAVRYLSQRPDLQKTRAIDKNALATTINLGALDGQIVNKALWMPVVASMRRFMVDGKLFDTQGQPTTPKKLAAEVLAVISDAVIADWKGRGCPGLSEWGKTNAGYDAGYQAAAKAAGDAPAETTTAATKRRTSRTKIQTLGVVEGGQVRKSA